jgi:hypothetical protein
LKWVWRSKDKTRQDKKEEEETTNKPQNMTQM